MDLGSGIREKPIPDPGTRVKKALDPGSGSATLLMSKYHCVVNLALISLLFSY
jgi:hypothetical protein